MSENVDRTAALSLDTKALVEAATSASHAVDLFALTPTPAALADALVRALTTDGDVLLGAGPAALARLFELAGALADEVDLARALALVDGVAALLAGPVAAAHLDADDPRVLAVCGAFAAFDLERVPLDRVRPDRWQRALALAGAAADRWSRLAAAAVART